MAQPPEIARIAAELGDLARRAWAKVQAALARLSGRQAQSRTLHREILATVGTEMGKLRQAIANWAGRRLPVILARGDADAAKRLGVGPALTPSQIELTVARHAVAKEMVSKALEATRNVEASTKALLRRVAADEVLGAILKAKSFDQVPGRVQKLMAERGVHAVRYSNGARHQIDDYMEMLTRTIAARAYNAAVLERGRRHGVMAVEISDGAGCQWPTSHGGVPAANGLVVSLDLAQRYPIAHPRCVRQPLLRPDIKDPSELSDGELPTARRDVGEQDDFHRLVAEALRAEVRRSELAERRPARVRQRDARLDARARRIAARLAARRAGEDIPDDLDVA